jgi:hypothetical protein
MYEGIDEASGPFSSGTQTFHDDSRLNATAGNAVTGGQINLRGGSIQIGMTNATTNGASIDVGDATGSGTLELNGYSTTLGKITGSDGTISNHSNIAATLTADTSALRDSTFGGVITNSTGSTA